MWKDFSSIVVFGLLILYLIITLSKIGELKYKLSKLRQLNKCACEINKNNLTWNYNNFDYWES